MVVAAFTDDTVMTLAVANAIIRCTDCRTAIKCFARNFPNLPYGGSFLGTGSGIPTAFLSKDYATAVKNAISLGGDADTMACIAGSIAQAYYKKVPADIVRQVRQNLPMPCLSCWINSARDVIARIDR